MKRVAFVLMCVCLAISMPSFADETIVYENDYEGQTPGAAFNEGSPWNWIDGDTSAGFVKSHTVTYQDDGTGNIVVDHNGMIDNSAGTTAVNTRFGTQWTIAMSGNISSEPADYIIEFDINSVSGNWDPIGLEFFVLTNGQGYGSGAADYNQVDGWVHIEMSLADLNVNWWAGTAWDLTNPTWQIEVGGPPYPGTSVPEYTPAWNQIWQMDNLKITQISAGNISYDPDPPDGARYVNVNPTLSWMPGVNADKHDIYLGTDFNDVNDANRTNPMDVLVEQNYDANTYAPDTLQYDTTYYWRIDDVNDPNIYKGSVWSFTTSKEYIAEVIVYENNYNNQTPGGGFGAWNWIDGDTANGFVKSHVATYQDDGTGNIVVDHNATINNSAGTTAVNCRFGSKWDITVAGNTSTDPGAYTIEFDLRNLSGNWDPHALEFFVLTYNPVQGTGTYGYGSGASSYYQSNGWVHVSKHLSDLNVTWWQGTNWDLTNPNWSIEVGGPPYPGTSVPAGTPAWNQIWQMDNLKITEFVGAISYDPFPPNGATRVMVDVTFRWTPGVYAATHDIYLGTDFNDVSDANRGSPMGVLDAQDYSGNTYEPNTLQYSTTYYWRIDDVNDANIYKGDVWSFTTRDASIIDDFDPYTATGDVFISGVGHVAPAEDTLKSVWVDGDWDARFPPETPTAGSSGSFVQLNTDTNDGNSVYAHYVADDENIYLSASQSMKFYYDNDGTVNWRVYLHGKDAQPEYYTYTPSPNPYLSEAYAATDDAAQSDEELDSLDMLRDWSGYNVIGIRFYGDPNNTTNNAGLYVSLQDNDGTLVTMTHPDLTQLTEASWHDWYIKLSDFTAKNGGLSLSNITRIYLGFGNKEGTPAAGGSGVVFFDDIQLFTGVCFPENVVGNFNNDCVVDNSDLEIFLYGFPGEMPSMPTPIISLVATGTVGSEVTSWANTGSLGGTFTDANANDPSNPVVAEILGKKCVTFDATDLLVCDQNAPATMTSDTNEPDDYTIIYEVYNPVIDNEELLFNWAQRGGPAGTCGGVGYGYNAAWGAVVHWNAGGLEPDMGFDLGVPAAGQWHTIAVTYDGTTESLITDGVIQELEDKDLAIYANQPVTVGAPYQPESNPNAAYIRGAYAPLFTNYRFTASVASIKVYADAVPPGDLAILTADLAGLPRAKADFRPDDKIDFKDLAVMGNNWMQDPYLFGEDY